MSINTPVKIVKLHPDAVIPKYARELDAGFDLVAIEDVIVEPGKTVKVRTGLALQLLPGYELQIRPRSGVSAKTKLRVSNAPGTVDAGYRGEVCVLIDNIYPYTGWINQYATTLDNEHFYTDNVYDEGTYLIRKGDRIAQGVVTVVASADFIVVDELDDSERGAGGFGSTGV